MAEHGYRRTPDSPTTRRYYSTPPRKQNQQCLRKNGFKLEELVLSKKDSGIVNDTVDRLRYDPKLYVERPELLRAVVEALTRLTLQKRATVLTIEGTRLAGKTWFAMHIMCNDTKDDLVSKIRSHDRLYISLEPNGAVQQPDCCQENCFYLHTQENEFSYHTLSADEQAKLLIRNLLVRLYRYFGINLPEDSSIWEIDSWVPEAMQRGAQIGASSRIICVDGITEATNMELRLFESYFLAYLLPQPNFIIVMLGKPAEGGWLNPSLRQDDGLQTIRPFEANEIKEQLERMTKHGISLAVNDSTELEQYSGGVPGTVSYLSRAGIDHSAVDYILDQLLSEKQQARLKFYFELLAPLDGFDDDILSHLRELDSFKDEEPLKENSRDIRNQLVATHLVNWDGNEGLFRLDPAVQIPVSKWMKKQETDRWHKIREAMVAYYNKWYDQANGMTDIQSYFESRRDYYDEKPTPTNRVQLRNI